MSRELPRGLKSIGPANVETGRVDTLVWPVRTTTTGLSRGGNDSRPPFAAGVDLRVVSLCKVYP
jgi:hypothetical protein